MNPRVHRSRVTHDRWLISYADFITLLFAFFVVLYAFAKADQKKQVQVSQSIDTAFRSLGVFGSVGGKPPAGVAPAGVGQVAAPLSIVTSEDMLTAARIRRDLDRIQRELTKTLSPQLANHTVSIQMGRDGLVISLREAGFFASGSATPKPQTLEILRPIAASVAPTAYDLRIEGHTDNVPIHNAGFDSNWELSTARATRIARMLLGLDTISPDRISAAGYAEFHPVASNDVLDGRAKNRRVDLVILPRATINFAHSDSAQPADALHKVTDGD